MKLTAEQIMNGCVPTSVREFDIPGVGKIDLHRLPADKEIEAQKLFTSPNPDTNKLEKVAQSNTYYMLHGKFDDKEAKKLPKLMDVNQLALIHSTGLFFTDLSQANLEGIEKN